MPSTLNSATTFRPMRWIVIAVVCCAIAYAVGYSQGLDDKTTSAPTTATNGGQR